MKANFIKKVSLTDAEIDQLEKNIPALARKATANAYQIALSSGFVVQAVGDVVCKVYSNGHKEEIEKISKPRKINITNKFNILFK